MYFFGSQMLASNMLGSGSHKPMTRSQTMLSLKKFSALALTLAASSAFATAVVPTYTTFGTLTGANFGGSGIPNNAVAITTSTALNGVTLGLTATQRFSSPAVMNNGAGVFQAVGAPSLPATTWPSGASTSTSVAPTPAHSPTSCLATTKRPLAMTSPPTMTFLPTCPWPTVC